MGVISRARPRPPAIGPDRWPARLAAVADRSLSGLDMLGDQLLFYIRAMLWLPRAVRRYLKEVLRLLAEVGFGSGALGLIGGTVGVMIGMTLSATVGAGFTAQLGSMRINEEVDALEAMGVPSLPYLVTTRIIAGVVAIIPLYAIGLVTSYFAQFLSPVDVLWSFVKVLIFSTMVVLIHCYYGYRASGGPAGVGVAVGR